MQTTLHSHNLAQCRQSCRVTRRKTGEYLDADLGKVLEEKDKGETKREREKERDRSRGQEKRFKGNHLHDVSYIRSFSELDLQTPEATKGSADKLQEVAEVDPLEVEDNLPLLNTDVMFVSHWNISPGMAPIESNDCLTNFIKCAIRFCNLQH